MTAAKTLVWAYSCPLCYEQYDPEALPDDGRCARCDSSPKLTEKQSEFGAGLVVCLAKFTEHLGERRLGDIWRYVRYCKKPEGENPLKFEEESFYRYPTLRRGSTAQESAVHDAIHNWANAAADHFYDLDEERAPEPLRELASLMLELRNAHLTDTPRLFTTDDLRRVEKLWQESCIALDEALGTVPNWGEY